MKQSTDTLHADILVIGAGLAGICASIQAARLGLDVVLAEKSLVLGGNSGPDAGVHPSGAHRFHAFAAETGIIEELCETAAWQGAKTATDEMHYNSSMLWDGVLDRALVDAGVTVLRSHYARDGIVENGKITSVILEDTGTYHTRTVHVGTAVVEASGDGSVAAKCGAGWRMGRESQKEYGERLAPEEADGVTMGSSVVALVRKTDRPVGFIPPPGTPPFSPGYGDYPSFRPGRLESLRFFFPTETGGQGDTIEDEPEIYRKALDQLYSAWDYVKNIKYVEEARNWELTWVGPRVCKRESRRFWGDYTLTQTDVERGGIFPDAVAYCGFAEDIHYPRPENPEYVRIVYHGIPPIYTIPYRCTVSRDIGNLFFASRLLSVSHIAHGTTRLQRTLSAVGQAVGVAAALCKKYVCTPRDIYSDHLEELQQTLLWKDGTVPGLANHDPLDKARFAQISADDELCFRPDTADRWQPLDPPCGVMLWDWPTRLESTAFLLRNAGNAPAEVKARLLLRRWEQGWKPHESSPGFPYEAVRNEVEWADNNACAIFKEVAQASAAVPPGEGLARFDWNIDLIPKQSTVDEERYLVELSGSDQVSLAVDDRFFDCARFVVRRGDAYEASPCCPVMNLTPTLPLGEAANVIDGVSRRFSYNPIHMWRTSTPAPHALTLRWGSPQEISMLQITFDTLQRTFHEMPLDCGKRAAPQCVRDYDVEVLDGAEWRSVLSIRDNYHRFRRHRLDTPLHTDALRLNVLSTWDAAKPVCVYEVRVY